jgi:hypothetical protein
VALAAKLVGRWPSGAPLVLSPERDEPQFAAANDFGYYARDPRGLACPLGAHVRRAKPRDTLNPQPGSADSLAVNKRHRILRRSRAYGPVDDSRPDPDVDRGLYFICLNASLTRQFEFVQHTWLNNPNFNGLYDDADPLVGARRPDGTTFTQPARPVRRRFLGVPEFVTAPCDGGDAARAGGRLRLRRAAADRHLSHAHRERRGELARAALTVRAGRHPAAAGAALRHGRAAGGWPTSSPSTLGMRCPSTNRWAVRTGPGARST